MGLYLCIFKDDDEIDGVEIGAYSDFNVLREYIVQQLEDGQAGSRFPNFILHSDSDGEWSVSECIELNEEIKEIILLMRALPPVPFISEWQTKVARSIALRPENAMESFIDVDGEFLLQRMQHLINLAIQSRLPILFQ
jgi:hypothetical protein